MALFALRDFARHPPPPPTTLLQHPRALAVFDAYPKAKYHFLVLARLPAAGGLSERDVDSLASLLRCRDHEARETIMSDLEAAADEVVEMVRDEMVKTTGREWGVQVGFHAVPSMR
jgi:aprataxin